MHWRIWNDSCVRERDDLLLSKKFIIIFVLAKTQKKISRTAHISEVKASLRLSTFRIENYCNRDAYSFIKSIWVTIHCLKSIQIWSFSGPYFPVFGLNTDIYRVNLRIQSKYRKIRTKKNSVFRHFSHSDSYYQGCYIFEGITTKSILLKQSAQLLLLCFPEVI